MQRRNNIFELVTVAPIHDVNQLCGTIDSFDEETEGTRLRLRGKLRNGGFVLYNIIIIEFQVCIQHISQVKCYTWRIGI